MQNVVQISVLKQEYFNIVPEFVAEIELLPKLTNICEKTI